MSDNASLHQRRQEAVSLGVTNLFGVYADRAENAELWDVEGRRHIDFASGIGTLNTGHRHPRVMAAVADQIARFTHAAFQVTPYESYIALAERLNALAPVHGAAKSIFFSSGAEAVENAIKIARAATGRPGVIAFSGGFHGRTLGAMALTGKAVPYRAGMGPLMGNIWHVPFPREYRGITGADSLAALDELFRCEVRAEEVAAIILEPVQGEGGFYVAPFDFLRSLRRICDDHGIVLIADEVQSGFGRTGRMFAVEHAGVAPDLMVLAKSLAGGLPLSGVVGRQAVMDAPAPGALGGTYAGSPVACAAALAVLDVIEAEDLCGRAVDLGRRLIHFLEDLADRPEGAAIGDIRGLGAMVAVELVADRQTRQPAPDLARRIMAEAGQRGLIVITAGYYGNCLRFLMPLTIPDAHVEEGLRILAEGFRAAVAAP